MTLRYDLFEKEILQGTIMLKNFLYFKWILLTILIVFSLPTLSMETSFMTISQLIKLPKPNLKNSIPLNEAIQKRRSVRNLCSKKLILDQIFKVTPIV